MTLAEKLLALHAVPPFTALRSEELLTVATAMTVQRFKPDQVICEAGGIINRLYVRVDGDALGLNGTVMQRVLGTTILLTGKAAPFAITAGPAGYVALALPRGKLVSGTSSRRPPTATPPRRSSATATASAASASAGSSRPETAGASARCGTMRRYRCRRRPRRS